VAQPAPRPVEPAREREGNGGPKTMLLDGTMLDAVRLRAAAAASAAPVRTSIPVIPSSVSSPTIASTIDTAISVRTGRPIPAVSSTNLRPARPGLITATYQVVPARIEASPFVLSKAVDSHLPLLMDESTERAAAFRALRRRLAEQKDPHAILVTSAQDDEGKTTCAANLALALAESGRRSVLLVEANLRRPKLSEIFGFQPERPLVAQLAAHREQIDAPWQTTELRPTGLHVLAAAPDTTGDEVLHGPTFSASITRWRCAFDYVVVDGPSILESCDASIIHDSVDAVVMVVRSGVSRNRTVKRALEQISADMVAGIVLMDGSSG
jgi:capsular exopolysaccharide synthesis family protein